MPSVKASPADIFSLCFFSVRVHSHSSKQQYVTPMYTLAEKYLGAISQNRGLSSYVYVCMNIPAPPMIFVQSNPHRLFKRLFVSVSLLLSWCLCVCLFVRVWWWVNECVLHKKKGKPLFLRVPVDIRHNHTTQQRRDTYKQAISVSPWSQNYGTDRYLVYTIDTITSIPHTPNEYEWVRTTFWHFVEGLS